MINCVWFNGSGIGVTTDSIRDCKIKIVSGGLLQLVMFERNFRLKNLESSKVGEF